MNNKTRVYIKNTAKGVSLVGLVYLFLLSITLIGNSFQLMGRGFAESIMQTVSNPLHGLAVGLLCTAIFQSSSLTTSLVVSLVAANVLTISLAVPIVMGANIGTSVTNLIVSLGHIRNRGEFERALGSAIIHDFFNILSVIVLFPIQYFTHIIDKSAGVVANLFKNIGGLKLVNPLGTILNPVSYKILSWFPLHPWIGIIIAFVLLFFALAFLVKVMKSLVISKIEVFFDQYLFKNTLRALTLGLLFTATIQSSSITTSLVVPLAAAGILSLEKIYPYALGTNVGTTITAFFASLATGDINAVTVAFCHTFFNIFGICIWLPLKVVPISLARWFSHISARRRYIPFIYLAIVFFIIPILIITFMR